MVLVIRCANGVVAWRSVKLRDGTWHLRCNRDQFTVALNFTVDQTWEAALTTVVTHSVALAGAFQNLWVLPPHL